MNNDTIHLEDLSEKLYQFISGLLEDGYEPPEVCIGLTSHAARLALQTRGDVDAVNIVGNLFLPVVHQLMDASNHEDSEEADWEAGDRITHLSVTVQ